MGVRSQLRAGLAPASILAAALACGGSEPAETGGGGEGDEAGDAETDDDTVLGDACASTTLIVEAPATVRASLRGATHDSDDFGLACGLTGPELFVRVRVPVRADVRVAARGHSFTPKLAVLEAPCVSDEVDASRLLACAELLPATLTDLGPQHELLVVLGVDADDPALALDPPEDPKADDPLALELEIDLQAVLEEGELCGEDRGRCEPGTACIVELEGGEGGEEGEGETGTDTGGEAVEIPRCRRPPADSCADPGELVLPAPGEAPLVLEIPGDEVHSDAHEHACTGWRRPERVDRLVLPAALPSSAELVVQADDPRVGLALRAPACPLDDARACAPATGLGEFTELRFGDPGELAELADGAAAPLLFIELPRARSADDPPIFVSLELRE